MSTLFVQTEPYLDEHGQVQVPVDPLLLRPQSPVHGMRLYFKGYFPVALLIHQQCNRNALLMHQLQMIQQIFHPLVPRHPASVLPSSMNDKDYSVLSIALCARM